jgi:exopolysaccharide biosynthesis polyprenyl glycosylphosphotransferase
MQIPRAGVGPSIARPSVPIAVASPRRERFLSDAVPAIVATVVGMLIVLINPGLMLATSALVGLVLAAVLLRERQRESNAIILVGRSPMAAMVAVTLEQQSNGRGQTILRAGHLAEAAAMARHHACDEVVLVGPTAPQSIPLVDARGQAPEVVPGAEKLEQLLNRIPLELAEQDRWLSRLHGARRLETGYALAKRATDIGVALGLSLALLPLFPLVALAIKLDSRGTIFYSQDRVGLNGRVFRIYKFRTMVRDAEKHGAVWATKTDSRVTRVGKFMRKTRMDELPQLWNLLRGDMALVGPRPERPEFTTRLAEEIPAYDLRHAVKPGLTGWAQVCYRYTSSFRDTRAKVEYDLYYVKHCSFLLDLRIMLRTFGVVLAMKGQ